MTVAPESSRSRILDAALTLMSEKGVAGTSMRSVAGACNLNVASLYHYFPSKADLLTSVITERGYFDRLAAVNVAPAGDTDASPADRLRKFVRWLWREAEAEEAVWRLIIGESLRGEEAARRTSAELIDSLDAAVAGWLSTLLPELGERTPAVSRLVRVLLLDLMVEQLALGADHPRALARIDDLVAALAPET